MFKDLARGGFRLEVGGSWIMASDTKSGWVLMSAFSDTTGNIGIMSKDEAKKEAAKAMRIALREAVADLNVFIDGQNTIVS